MQLVGSMVNNCGTRFHSALNDEKFTREIGNAVRYFSKRLGTENKNATDVSLDLIQSWGEAFLPQRKKFYHIVDLYFNLRKEGLPFKVQQFDPTRVPIFANNNGGTSRNSGGAADNTDAILAAALQSSMAQELSAQERDRRRHQHHHQQHQQRQPSGRNAYADHVVEEVRNMPYLCIVVRNFLTGFFL